MIFAKIDFINLLPFHIFIKKNIQSSQQKSIIEYKKSYPSYINIKFKKRKVDRLLKLLDSVNANYSLNLYERNNKTEWKKLLYLKLVQNKLELKV